MKNIKKMSQEGQQAMLDYITQSGHLRGGKTNLFMWLLRENEFESEASHRGCLRVF